MEVLAAKAIEALKIPTPGLIFPADSSPVTFTACPRFVNVKSTQFVSHLPRPRAMR